MRKNDLSGISGNRRSEENKEEIAVEWREYARILKGLLGLRGSPVAVTYSMMSVPENEMEKAL